MGIQLWSLVSVHINNFVIFIPILQRFAWYVMPQLSEESLYANLNPNPNVCTNSAD